MLSLVVIMLFFGCNNIENDNLKFSQEITIVKMSSTPKYKTVDSISTVNQVTDILNEIEKSPIDSENDDQLDFVVNINIDGESFEYSIGKIFTDANGRKYKIENYKDTIDKISKIYNKIDVEEKKYK